MFQFVDCLPSIVVRESEPGPDIVQNADGNDGGLYDICFGTMWTFNWFITESHIV